MTIALIIGRKKTENVKDILEKRNKGTLEHFSETLEWVILRQPLHKIIHDTMVKHHPKPCGWVWPSGRAFDSRSRNEWYHLTNE